jgi:tRNA 2-(methylsulfanyl)-N6-isopentenyladenosine37 hydroxylase
MDANEELPLLSVTPRSWAEIAARSLDVFLADHAVCEQQAALNALSLIGQYPADEELVERMSSLAAEEIAHLRRVAGILRRRKIQPAGRRTNPWVRGLHDRMETRREPERQVDRLLVGALIEARSCERFTRLGEVVDDPEVRGLLQDLGPAEARHWRLFYGLAARLLPAGVLEARWAQWLEVERDLTAALGVGPTVHG